MHKDLPYGPDARTSTRHLHWSGAALAHARADLLLVHGGGFTGGSKEANAHVGEFFGTLGLVGVVINYRLAPDIKWPAGAEESGRPSRG